MFPDSDTFNLPFTTVIANLKAQEEYGLRLCKNIDRLNLTGDAWAFSVTKGFIRSEARKKLKNPKKLLNYVGRGIEWSYASALNNTRSRAVCLPTPILRYPCLFRENFIERCKGYADNINLPYYQNAEKNMQMRRVKLFEKVAKEYRENNHINYVGDTGVFEGEEHPAIIREFIENRNSITKYYVRDSVLDQ